MDTSTAAKRAIRSAGGSRKLAEVLSEITGEKVTDAQIRKWSQRGIPPKWVPAVTTATKIPAADLHPAFSVSSAA